MAGISGREVISFFKNADLELAELVLEFGQTAVEARVEARAKISANLKKARAARKPKDGAEVATPVQAEAPVDLTPIQEVTRHRGRVPAPTHTAEATSVASD